MHDRTKDDPTPSLSLILPAWNEAEIIETAIQEADQAIGQITQQYEVIVVDDGSSDETASIVARVAQTNPNLRLIRHQVNQGYGASLRSGFVAAKMDLVAFTDADCQFDLTELDRFTLLARRYDVVCGFRIDRKDTTLRCLYSKVYNLLVRLLLGTGVRDVDCALKMFKRVSLCNLRITGNGFLVNSEMLVQARQKGLSVVEVGVSHRPRTAGTSTVSIRHIPRVLSGMAKYWWNEVQFPGRPRRDRRPDPADSPLGFKLWSDGCLQALLLLIAALFLFTNLNYPLIDRDETRYAEIPREMLATGNWILPQLNFQPYYDKPPLVYWLCAISFKLFGVSEFAARLVPALAAFLTIAATMWFGNRNFGKRIGLLSGIVLMLSVGFAFASRYLLLDGVLALFVTMSLTTAYEAIKSSPSSTKQYDEPHGKREANVHLGWWCLSGVFIGLAFLTKGPLALVLWLPPVFAMAWLSESFAKPRWWHYGLIGLVTSAIILPWFIAVSFHDPNFVTEFFVTHNVRRFAGEFHARPIWFFVPVLLIAGHPWSFLTIPYTRFLFGRSEDIRRERPQIVGFLMLWSAWSFVFFSLSSCKLPTYLLPAAPAFALMMGHYMDQLLSQSSESTRHWFARIWSARTATATTCAAGVGFVTFIVATQPDLSATTYIWAMFWTSLLIASLLLLGDRYQARTAWATSSGVAFLFAVMVMHQMVPAYSRSQTLFGDSSPLCEQLAIDNQPAIATIEHEFSEVPFYLDRANIANFPNINDARIEDYLEENPTCILVVDSRIAGTSLRRHMPTGSQVVPIFRRGSATLYRVTTLPESGQTAQRKTVVR